MTRLRRSVPLCLAILAIAATGSAGAPRIDRPDGYLDELLGREYDGGTPLRTTGPGLWTSHPVGWGFANGVHYVHYNNMEAVTLEILWDGQAVAAGPAYARESYLETWALPVGDLLLNTAGTGLPSATGPAGDAWPVLDGDRRPLDPWIATPAGPRTVLDVHLPGAQSMATVRLSIVEDAARGIALPDQLSIEWFDGATYQPVTETGRTAPTPLPGDYAIHFTAVTTDALRIQFQGTDTIAIAEVEAYPPSRSALQLVERKFVSDDDALVVVTTATNPGPAAMELTVRASSSLTDTASGVAFVGALDLTWIPVFTRLELVGGVVEGGALARRVTLAAGATTEVRTVLSVARTAGDASARVAAHIAAPDPVADSVAVNAAWFRDNVPQLDVPDAWFGKAYAYRWQVVRRNLSEPGYGRLQHPTFMEGRWAPWYSEVITYGAPHQLREVRWLRDPRFVRGHALTLVDNLRADGAFIGASVDAGMREYTDWIAAALWEVYLTTGDTDLLARSIAAMSANLDYTLTRDPDGDALPVVADHYETGMEWQPAFFYFDNYDATRSTPLERVDYAAAFYGNAAATAAASRALCDASGGDAKALLAERIRAAVVAKMWDPATGFYYSLREGDDAKALAREIVGFYPFAFDLAPPEHETALTALFDPAEFWTTWPPASSSLTCPATSMEGWPIGPGGSAAMWNGPTWPHAISVVADAIANVVRRSGEAHATRAGLFEMIDSYTRAQFCCVNDDRDLAKPQIGEYYHGWRGFWKTSERDYFHSTYADILITHLIGLKPHAGATVRVDPLLPPGTWDHFLLDRAPYRGHEVTIVWDAAGGDDHYGDGREGLDLYIDDQLVATRPDLGLLEAPLPPALLLATRDMSGQPTFLLARGATPWTLFRATDATLADGLQVPGGPFPTPLVTDDLAPPADILYYRSGGCGFGL